MKNKVLILNILAMIVLLPCVFSCKRITSFFDNSNVVAKVGNYKLYASDLNDVIPNGIPSEDSVKLALQYINSWASNKIFLDLAEKELSKGEKEVTKELEDYRSSLLRYRYEQKYINQRLDTLVTQKEIDTYYEGHLETFKLERPILKVRFVRIAEDSPNKDIIIKKLASEKEEDVDEVDSLAYKSALKYTTYGDTWVDAAVLATEFSLDYNTMMSQAHNNYIKIPDGNGNLNVAYILQVVRAGEIGPVEYYKNRIKDIILSSRKQKLISDLENELLEKAGRQENLVIY